MSWRMLWAEGPKSDFDTILGRTIAWDGGWHEWDSAVMVRDAITDRETLHRIPFLWGWLGVRYTPTITNPSSSR
jgi:hypothetical protein